MDADLKIAAEMQLARFAQKTNGLRMTETHVKVLTLLDQTDKFTLLGLIDDMIDDLTRNGVRALGQNTHNLSKRQALLLLGDLRRWFVMCYCNDVVACCDKLREWQRKAMVLAAQIADNKAVKDELKRAKVEISKLQLNNEIYQNMSYDSIVDYVSNRRNEEKAEACIEMMEYLWPKPMHDKFRDDVEDRRRKKLARRGGTPNVPQTVNIGTLNGTLTGEVAEQRVGLGMHKAIE